MATARHAIFWLLGFTLLFTHALGLSKVFSGESASQSEWEKIVRAGELEGEVVLLGQRQPSFPRCCVPFSRRTPSSIISNALGVYGALSSSRGPYSLTALSQRIFRLLSCEMG